MLVLAVVGAALGLRAGMPAWWMAGDAACCMLSYAAMLWLQRRIAPDMQQG